MKKLLKTRLAATTGAALAASALVATTPTPAHAWGLTPPVLVGASATQLTVSGNIAGQAAAAWVVGGQVFVSQKQIDDNVWSAPVAVSAATEVASAPDIAVGPAGDVALAWEQAPAGGQPEVWLAQQDHGAAWVPARMVSDPDPTKPGDHAPQVEIGAAAGVTVVWSGTTGDTTASIIRSRAATSAGLGAQINQFGLSAGATFDGLTLARSGNADLVTAWRSKNLDGSFSLVANRRGGGTWAAPAVMSTAANVDLPSATMDGRGNAWIGAAVGVPGASGAAFWPWLAGRGAPDAPVQLDPTNSASVQLAANYSGQLVASWINGGGLIFSDVRSGVPTNAQVVGGAIAAQSVAYSDTGAATLAWSRPGNPALGVSFRELDGSWMSQEIAAPVGVRPSAVAQSTYSLVVYGDSVGGQALSTVVDTAAPTAVHLTAPLRPFSPSTDIPVGWVGSDPSSTITYEVSRSVTGRTGGPSPMSVWTNTNDTSAMYRAGRGQTVCFQVRGLDGAQNASGTSLTRCTTTPLNDNLFAKGKVKGKKAWTKVSKGKAFAGSFLQTRKLGATLTTKKVKGTRFGLLVYTAAQSGQIKVTLGSRTLGTYSLKSPGKWRGGETILLRNFGQKVQSGKLKITVTSSGKPVRIDGFFVGR